MSVSNKDIFTAAHTLLGKRSIKGGRVQVVAVRWCG